VLTRLLAAAGMGVAPRRTRRRFRGFRQIAKQVGRGSDARRLFLASEAFQREGLFQVLREYRPGGWNPRIRIVGREHLDEALRRGRGAVLWMGPTLLWQLVSKKALHGAGYGLHHLSGAHHGFESPTRFGATFLNPVRTRIEERYLAQRIVIPADRSLGYLRSLEGVLASNGPVSMNCISLRGQVGVEKPLLGATARYARGPAGLAVSAHAGLLPVFVLRRSPAEFDVVIQEPIEFDAAVRAREAVEWCLAEYADRVAALLGAHLSSLDPLVLVGASPVRAAGASPRMA
jgi:hypothetical protein